MISPATYNGARILPFIFNRYGIANRRPARGIWAWENVTKKVAVGSLAQEGTTPMAATEPDDLPKKKIAHEIGQDLSLLSLGELAERIGLLKDEIARLEAEMTRKSASQRAADSFFKK
jgi:uncharacterized small protein (DUF1192 family)